MVLSVVTESSMISEPSETLPMTKLRFFIWETESKIFSVAVYNFFSSCYISSYYLDLICSVNTSCAEVAVLAEGFIQQLEVLSNSIFSHLFIFKLST